MITANLTRAALLRAIDKASAAGSKILDEMIAAGRGHERPTETFTKTDDLSARFQAEFKKMQALESERRSRLEWHGTEHRITRRQVDDALDNPNWVGSRHHY